MEPQNNVEGEALLKNSMENSETLKSIDSNSEAGVVSAMNTEKAVRDVEQSVDIQTQVMDKKLTDATSNLETMARAQDLIATFITKLTGPKGDKGDKGELTEEDIDMIVERVVKKLKERENNVV